MRKTAIVTGAAKGIGYATVKLLAEKGFQVTAFSRTSKEDGDALFFDEKNVCYVSGDVSVAEDRERLLQTAIEAHGPVGVLVNVAGVAPQVRADLLEMTEESYDRVLNINTKGTLFLTQAVAKHMVEHAGDEAFNGAIVNISSMSAYTSSVSRGEYCISKAGVSMITKLFADRLSSYNITVNEICPGVIKTAMTSTVEEKYDRLIAEGLFPLARWGTPEDVAKAVYVLCSGQLGYTTGQSLDVDGGFRLRRL